MHAFPHAVPWVLNLIQVGGCGGGGRVQVETGQELSRVEGCVLRTSGVHCVHALSKSFCMKSLNSLRFFGGC